MSACRQRNRIYEAYVCQRASPVDQLHPQGIKTLSGTQKKPLRFRTNQQRSQRGYPHPPQAQSPQYGKGRHSLPDGRHRRPPQKDLLLHRQNHDSLQKISPGNQRRNQSQTRTAPQTSQSLHLHYQTDPEGMKISNLHPFSLPPF